MASRPTAGAAMALTHPTYQVVLVPFAAAVAVSRKLRPARKVAGLALLLLASGIVKNPYATN